MQETTLTAGISSLVLNDIKRIDVTNSAVTSAQQVIRKYLFEKKSFFFFGILASYLFNNFNKCNTGSSNSTS
jgi:hypothetical protein